MLFESGQILLTASVYETSKKDSKFEEFIYDSLKRHLNGDWGDLCKKDVALNNESVTGNNRILSSYTLKEESIKYKIYIITEADRKSTTILFPQEY